MDAEEEFEAVIARSDVDAVAIATPVDTHGKYGALALKAGKHVLVEKPLASSVQDATAVCQLAEKLGLTLMVDHTFVYSPAVRKMKEIIDAGDLGELYYIDSVRINLGIFQHDVNVLWDLAPHDLSILDYLIGKVPKSLAAFGSCHANPEIEDVAYLNLDFSVGLLASFHVNWLSPVKVRHFIVGGSKKSIVYNDLDRDQMVKFFDRGIVVNQDAELLRKTLISYRTGDIWSPHIDRVEPLQQMVQHFATSIANRNRPLTDGEAGLHVVRILEAAQRSIKAQGGRITL